MSSPLPLTPMLQPGDCMQEAPVVAASREAGASGEHSQAEAWERGSRNGKGVACGSKFLEKWNN